MTYTVWCEGPEGQLPITDYIIASNIDSEASADRIKRNIADVFQVMAWTEED